MLELTQQQLEYLDELEKQQFVAEVHKDAVREHPELAGDAGLKDRMESAYRCAVSIGLRDGPAITQFLRYEAIAPFFYRAPAIAAWLTKPGQSAEQRLSDLLEATRSRMKDY